MPHPEGQPTREPARMVPSTEPSVPLDWSADETVALTKRAEEIATLRDKIISRASTPAEELRFKNLVDEMKGMIEVKEAAETGPEFRELINREQEALKTLFGKEIEIPPLPQEITPEKYKEWKEKGFELHYLPPVVLSETGPDGKKKWKELPGWTKKPEKGPEEIHSELPGGWMLVDTRQKPNYDNGAQIYPNDEVIGKALETLRRGANPVIEPYDAVPNPKSRFGIRGSDFEKPEVQTALAASLGVNVKDLDLPYAIENSLLMHMHMPEWGNTTTLEWLKDKTADSRDRLYGGNSDGGGLSYVYWVGAAGRHEDVGFRPLGRFSSKK